MDRGQYNTEVKGACCEVPLPGRAGVRVRRIKLLQCKMEGDAHSQGLANAWWLGPNLGSVQ